MQVKILDPRLNDWGLPAYQTAGAAGIDLFACIDAPLAIEAETAAVLIPAGIAVKFDNDSFAGLILPRSSMGHKRGLVMGNSVGLIDPDYTGQIFISSWNRNPRGSDPIVIQPGERIAQMIFVPVLRPHFEVVAEFDSQTARGAGGFGSTGS